jgi:hypothetical protein
MDRSFAANFRTMTAATKLKTTEEIKRNLFSDDDAIVRAAIQRCQEEGSALLVEPLIAFYASNAPEELRMEVATMLSSLKVSGVDGFFLSAINNPEMIHVRKDLLSFIWNSGLQPVNAIGDISKIAVEGDFATVLECLTILESLETVVPEEIVLDSISTVRQFLSSQSKSEKNTLLVEYLRILDDMRAQSENS